MVWEKKPLYWWSTTTIHQMDENQDSFQIWAQHRRILLFLIIAGSVILVLTAISLLVLGITLPLALTSSSSSDSANTDQITYVQNTYAIVGAGAFSASNEASVSACQSVCSRNSNCAFITYIGTQCSLYDLSSSLSSFGGGQVDVYIKYVNGKSEVQITNGPG